MIAFLLFIDILYIAQEIIYMYMYYNEAAVILLHVFCPKIDHLYRSPFVVVRLILTLYCIQMTLETSVQTPLNTKRILKT